MQKVLLTFSSY